MVSQSARIVVAVLLTAAMPRVAQAQSAQLDGPLTLERALELAELHSDAIAIAQAGVDRAAAELRIARSGAFPQLNVAASYERTLASEFQGLFRAPDASLGSELNELPFGRENTWRANLSLSQSLFTGGRLSAQSRLASAGQVQAGLQLTSSRAEVLFVVTQAYYDAALSQRVVSIAEATFGQAQATLTIVQAGFNSGTQPEFELLRARVARDNQMPTLIRQRTSRDLALLRLKQLLELPPETDLHLADSLEAPALPPPPAFATRVAVVEAALHTSADDIAQAGVPVGARNIVKQASAAVQMMEAAVDAAHAERLPSAALSSSYGRVAYPAGLFPEGDFRTNWTVAATVQVPILTGGRLRGAEQSARADRDQSLAQLRQLEKMADLDTRSAVAQLVAARAAWEASAGTLQQASRAYDIADVRYRAGVSTQLELADSRLLLQQAALNRAQTARDLQVARARIALLPDLPIDVAQPTPTTPQLPTQVPVAPAAPSRPESTPATPGSTAVAQRGAP